MEQAVTAWSFTMRREGIEQILLTDTHAVAKMAAVTDETVTLCDVTIALGRVARFVEGLEVSEEQRAKLKAYLESDSREDAEVKLTVGQEAARCTTVYLDHLPPEERARYPPFSASKDETQAP
jgi:hypothetical protein